MVDSRRQMQETEEVEEVVEVEVVEEMVQEEDVEEVRVTKNGKKNVSFYLLFQFFFFVLFKFFSPPSLLGDSASMTVTS